MTNLINTFIDEAWKYSVDNVENVCHSGGGFSFFIFLMSNSTSLQAILPYVNKWVAHIIATQSLEAALDMEYEISVNYTSPDFYEELHG